MKNYKGNATMTITHYTEALKVAVEWQGILNVLVEETASNIETVANVALKPDITGHPFYHGKMSALTFLKEMADEDVTRFEGLQSSEANIKEVMIDALRKAYLRMLQLPHGTFRSRSQMELAALRGAIAEYEQRDEEQVQNDYQRRADFGDYYIK